MTPPIWRLDDIPDDALSEAGGKALNLGRLRRAGFPVPDGFCLTASAYRLAGGQSVPGHIAAAACQAYDALGGGPVAVRSSATAEDLPEASFAGQQETFLSVEGHEALIGAIGACWVSLHGERARAYRLEQGIAEDDLAMAVVVQRMVAARAAGVLFTIDPSTGDANRMVVEAVAGLGEALVSGHAIPQRFVIRRTDVSLQEGPAGAPLLDRGQLSALCELGARIEESLGGPQDIEWAIDDDGPKILQARAVTGLGRQAELLALIDEERQRLSEEAGGVPTVWSSYQAAEVVHAPLPMTFAVLSRWLSRAGGHGAAHRALGYSPEDTGRSVLELICGRAYYNLNEEARSYLTGVPYAPNVAAIKAHPPSAAEAVPELQATQAGCGFIFALPAVMWRLSRAVSVQRRLKATYVTELTERVFPEFESYIERERAVDLSRLDARELVDTILRWIDHLACDFGRHAIQPSILAGEALLGVQRTLSRSMDADAAKQVARQLVSGDEGNRTTEAAYRLWQVGNGEVSLEAFLEEFGHRAAGELELATPRWREEPEQVRAMAEALRGTACPARRVDEARARRQAAQADVERQLGSRAATLRAELDVARRYAPFRENPKHYFLMEYELIRAGLLELGKRCGIDDGVFYLVPDELPRLAAGEDLGDRIRQRRRRRRLALQVPVPEVIFSDDLEAIGRPQATAAAEGALSGLGVSSGSVTGVARVLGHPGEGAQFREGEILVAPSTDPGWTPIVVRAAGLVLEKGGMLSHGAVVAREYGLPAVTNVHEATTVIRTGSRLRIDGTAGRVEVLEGPA